MKVDTSTGRNALMLVEQRANIIPKHTPTTQQKPWALDPSIWHDRDTLHTFGECEGSGPHVSNVLIKDGYSLLFPSVRYRDRFFMTQFVSAERYWFCSVKCMTKSLSCPQYTHKNELN